MSDDQEQGAKPKAARGLANKALLALHAFIILNFLIEIIYASYMLFVVMAPEGHSGPLFGAARTLDADTMHTRRLYALENWIAIAGLSVYLALTEIGPRLRAMRSSSN